MSMSRCQMSEPKLMAVNEEHGKSPPVFPLWPGTAVSAGTSVCRGRSWLRPDCVICSNRGRALHQANQAGAGHWDLHCNEHLTFLAPTQELKKWPSVLCCVDVLRTLSSAFREPTVWMYIHTASPIYLYIHEEPLTLQMPNCTHKDVLVSSLVSMFYIKPFIPISLLHWMYGVCVLCYITWLL